MTVAVVCPNLIGDTVMATPTFRAIRAGFPSSRVVAVVRPGVAPVLDGGPWFDDRILSDHRSKMPEYQPRAVLERLRGERVETMVLLPNSFRSALLAWRSGARRRVGYARGGRSLLLTDRLVPPRDRRGAFRPTPIVDYYLALARRLGCPVDSLRTDLHDPRPTTRPPPTGPSPRLRHIAPGASVVCLNTGGAFGPAAKAWPRKEHFAVLAKTPTRDRNRRRCPRPLRPRRARGGAGDRGEGRPSGRDQPGRPAP